MKEYKDLTADPLQDTITAGPVSEDNMLEWEALIQGPEGTPYVCPRCLIAMLMIRKAEFSRLSSPSLVVPRSTSPAHDSPLITL